MSGSPDDLQSIVEDHELRIAADSLLLGCLLSTIGFRDQEMLQGFVTRVTDTLASTDASPSLTSVVEDRLAPLRAKFSVK